MSGVAVTQPCLNKTPAESSQPESVNMRDKKKGVIVDQAATNEEQNLKSECNTSSS